MCTNVEQMSFARERENRPLSDRQVIECLKTLRVEETQILRNFPARLAFIWGRLEKKRALKTDLSKSFKG